MNKKKMLVLAHLFYPETVATAQLYYDLFRELQHTFNITVVCSVPTKLGVVEEKYSSGEVFEEQLEDIKIIRVKVKNFNKEKIFSRVKNIASYYFAVKKVIKKLGDFDYTFACSQPPILGGVLGRYSKKKNHSKLIYNIQDFQPESARVVFKNKHKFLLNVLKRVDNKSIKKSDLVITVGTKMQKTLNNRFKNKNVPKNVIISNWADKKLLYPVAENDEHILAFKREHNLENKFVVMYSGNLGLYYDLENILDVLARFKDYDNVEFVFIGEGAKKSKLIEKSKSLGMQNIQFLKYESMDNMVYSLNCANLHLITSALGVKGVSVPSKIYSIMAINKPFVCISEQGSEVCEITKLTPNGTFVEIGDYEKLYFVLKKLIDENVSSKEFDDSQFDKQISIQKYIKEILAL